MLHKWSKVEQTVLVAILITFGLPVHSYVTERSPDEAFYTDPILSQNEMQSFKRSFQLENAQHLSSNRKLLHGPRFYQENKFNLPTELSFMRANERNLFDVLHGKTASTYNSEMRPTNNIKRDDLGW
ncbi:hypothetical protein EG68_06566 [Paragonimus skrjabini miyazakii]|uniref:Uncharacterized protein n=1 Tax=Paragonimus skrjabini miyazakii TaxID=59628 RepID=A0A8S9YPY2_9TREM|nr:hypothetical protein EG68_06566 [Paragonimus skrjabini miyazakii]